MNKKQNRFNKFEKGNTRVGSVQKKILLLLFGGLTLGFSRSPRRYFRIIGVVRKEWKAINRRTLRESIKRLYESRLLEEQHHGDGSMTFILSDAGRRRALTFSVDHMSIKRPAKWDGKWRVVIFDVPERQKSLRDAFRVHLRRMSFYELQKSVFVHPYPCADEIDFLIEVYEARQYVRTMTVESIDNELHLQTHFHLSHSK